MPAPASPAPRFVLGDRFGAAAGREVVDRIEAAFVNAGLRVARNAPFAGAYIAPGLWSPVAEHPCRAGGNRPGAVHGRGAGGTPPDFAAFRDLIGQVVAEITGNARRRLPLAARVTLTDR